MKKRTLHFIYTTLAAMSFALFIASPVMVTAVPQPVSAACGDDRFLGIPPWYRGLTKETDGICNIVSPNAVGGLNQFIWRIVLNVIDMALVIVGDISVFFLLYGGFQFVAGGGSSDQVAKARKTILNAIIGLAIALGSIGILNLIFGVLD